MADVLRLGQGEPERPRIAVVGCGGAGCNTLDLVPPDLGLTRVALNDAPHRSMAGISNRLLLPKETLYGIASVDDAAVKQLVTPEEKQVSGAILNHDLVVPVAGLGGETGGPGAALVGRVVRILGSASMALVALPFSAEGLNRRASADRALELLPKRIDGVVAFPNDELLKIAPQLPLVKAFRVLGAIMVRPLLDLARVLTKSDVPVLRDTFRGLPRWRFGAGEGAEKHRAFTAVEEAFSSPWLPPKGDVLERVIAIASSSDFSEGVAGEVEHEIRIVVPRANILLGGFRDESLGDRLRVSVLGGW